MSERTCIRTQEKKKKKNTSTHALELKVQWKCSCGLVLETSYSQRNLSEFTALISDGARSTLLAMCKHCILELRLILSQV